MSDSQTSIQSGFHASLPQFLQLNITLESVNALTPNSSTHHRSKTNTTFPFPPTSTVNMPAGFPNIRYDPTNDPRYPQARSAPKKEKKDSKKSYLSEKGMPCHGSLSEARAAGAETDWGPLTDATKSKSSDEKSLSSTASRRGLLSVFKS